MNRLFAVLGALFCVIALIFAVGTEEGMETVIDLAIHGTALVLFIFPTVFYCGFAAMHAVSHVKDPRDRSMWMLLTVGFNLGGALLYFLTKYQDFRSHGMGGLGWKKRKEFQTMRSFFSASSAELETKTPESKD